MIRTKKSSRISFLVPWCLGGSITCSLFSNAPALAQLSPGDLTPSTQSAQPEQVKIITPTIHKEQNEVVLPAAFWNEHLADWVEVAITGRPSDFLHETIAAVTTTKTKMEEALRTVGFHDADAWVTSINDFPRVRGDQAIILLTATVDNKTETFSLDELLTFEGWNTPVGPFGWMFKGSPGMPASTAPAPEPVFAPNQQILRDDPQIALEFKGLQHLSQSYMDHPLCYDNWIYPDFHYHRNTRIVPKTLEVPPLSEASQKTLAAGLAEFLNDPKIPATEIQRRLQNPTAAQDLSFTVTRDGKTVNIDFKTIARNAQLHDFWMDLFNSNGGVPVQLTIRHVTETELLKQSAELWHDPAAAKFILDQLPIAAQIDKYKAALWTTVAPHNPTDAPASSLTLSTQLLPTPVLIASIEKGYAALDAAWSQWACDHAQLDSQDPHDIEEFTSSKKLWQEHMNQKRDRAAELLAAEQAHFHQIEIQQQPDSPGRTAALRQSRGQEIVARNRAMLLENAQPLDFWAQQKARLAADDPRQDWRRHIATQLDRAQGLTNLANAGVQFGNALQAADQSATPTAQHAYEVAVLRGALATLNAQLAEVDFEISKRQDFPDDRELPGFLKRRDALRAEIQSNQSSLEKLTAQP